jgi:hypothetical protein
MSKKDKIPEALVDHLKAIQKFALECNILKPANPDFENVHQKSSHAFLTHQFSQNWNFEFQRNKM